jgi:hypothetical protein
LNSLHFFLKQPRVAYYNIDNPMTVFLLILKRDRDRRVHERPRKNDRQYDFSSKWSFLNILVRTLMDATVTDTLQNQKKHCIHLENKYNLNKILALVCLMNLHLPINCGSSIHRF